MTIKKGGQKPAKKSVSTGKAKRSKSRNSRLNDLPFYLAGIYYEFTSLIDRSFLIAGLDQHFRPGMGGVFLALCEEDDCIIKSLVDRLQIANGTLTGLLKSMEKAGLIERYRCPEDGRATRIKLTPLGRTFEDPMLEAHKGAMKTLQVHLNRQEIQELKRLLGQILDNMRQDRRQWKLERRSVVRNSLKSR